jgi:hypothetical protein
MPRLRRTPMNGSTQQHDVGELLAALALAQSGYDPELASSARLSGAAFEERAQARLLGLCASDGGPCRRALPARALRP